MNYRRSLLRVWVAGSLCWIGYWIWHYTSTCSLVTMGGRHAITCRWETAEASGMAVATQTAPALPVLQNMIAMTLGVPGCTIVAGLVFYWVIERFRHQAR
jgi:hypothetical protein